MDSPLEMSRLRKITERKHYCVLVVQLSPVCNTANNLGRYWLWFWIKLDN